MGPKRGEGWGAMDNDYLTPVLVNKQVVKREELKHCCSTTAHCSLLEQPTGADAGCRS